MANWLKAATSWMTNQFGAGAPINAAEKGLTFVSNWLDKFAWNIESSFFQLVDHGYRRNSIVYSCLSVLSAAIAEAPLAVYTATVDEKTGDRVRLKPDHPLMKLIRRPNELMTEFEFWEMATVNVNVKGHAFWFKERNALDDVVALWPLRPDRVGPVYSTSQEPGERVLYGWSYVIPGTTYLTQIERRDMMCFSLFDPTGESGGIVEGMGPLEVLAMEIAADNEATKFVGAIVSNAALTTVAIRVKMPLSNPQQAEMIKQRFQSQFGGARRGEPILLDADTEIEQLGFNLQELEFPALRRVSETRICAAFGVPAMLVGLQSGTEAATFNNVSEAREYFAETTCSTLWRRFQDQYQLDIIDEVDESLSAEFDTAKVTALAGQRKEQIAPIAEAWGSGAATRNEYRRALHLPPMPSGECYLINKQTVPVTYIPSDPPDPLALAAAGGGPPGSDPSDGSDGPRKIGAPKQLGAPKGSNTASKALRAAPPPELTGYEDDLRERLADLLEVTASDLARRIRAHEPFDEAELAAALTRLLGPSLAAIVVAEELRLATDIGVGFDVATIGAQAAEWSATYVPLLIKGLSDTTRPVVEAAIVAYGNDPTLAQRDLKALLTPAFGAVRADMIAITEVTRASAQAARAYQTRLASAGVDMELVWHTNNDELVCPICAPLDGQSEEAWKAHFPDGPPGHVRCRCFSSLRLKPAEVQRILANAA